MIDPISHSVALGVCAVAGITAARALYERCPHVVLQGCPGDLKSLQDECKRLEKALVAIERKVYAQHRDRDSPSKHILQIAPSGVETVIQDASSQLEDLQNFVEYVIAKAKAEEGGDHWQWIRKKNNIDRLRGALRSIRYDLNVQLNGIYPDCFEGEVFLGRRANRRLVSPSLPAPDSTFSNHCQRIEAAEATIAVWSQLNKESGQAESASASRQTEVWPVSNTGIPEQTPRSFHLQKFCSIPIRQYLRLYLSSVRRIRRKLRSIPPCHILILLGFLTIVGSLTPALWFSIDRSDMSGGFAVAQYILAVGALVLACVLAIHSKTCTCWSAPRTTTPGQGALQNRGALQLPVSSHGGSQANGATAS